MPPDAVRGGIKIKAIDFIGNQDVWDFEVRPHHNYELAGIVHHNSGKSLVGYAIVASTFTGLPLLDHEGNPLPRFIDHRPPHVIWTIGLGNDHIGQTIHRYLFCPGAFQVIEDEKTGELRAYRPWSKKDRARKNFTKPAPPLISPRFLVGGEPKYDNRGLKIFNNAEGKDGTLLYAYTSKGDVKMGDPVALLHVDEDIENNSHVPEWLSRLEYPWSKFLWTAFPWSHAAALRMMCRRAEEEEREKREGKRAKAEYCLYRLNTEKNVHIDNVVQQRRKADFMMFSPEEYAARVKGEFNDHLVEMYPGFSVEVHGTPSVLEDGDDQIDRAVRKCRAAGGIIPADWSLDVIIDPGHTHPGALICAVPPPSLGDAGVVVAEFYQPNTGAREMVLALNNLLTMLGNRMPERTIIDSHAARQSYMGMSGITVAFHYMKEFSQANYRARLTGSAFQHASDNLEGDLMEVRRVLSPGPNGRPWLRFLRDYIVHFPRQMEEYRKHVTKDLSTDKPASGQKDCLCDCIRYWCASRPQHRLPVKKETIDDARMAMLREEGLVGGDQDAWSVRCGPPEHSAW